MPPSFGLLQQPLPYQTSAQWASSCRKTAINKTESSGMEIFVTEDAFNRDLSNQYYYYESKHSRFLAKAGRVEYLWKSPLCRLHLAQRQFLSTERYPRGSCSAPNTGPGKHLSRMWRHHHHQAVGPEFVVFWVCWEFGRQGVFRFLNDPEIRSHHGKPYRKDGQLAVEGLGRQVGGCGVDWLFQWQVYIWYRMWLRRFL